MWIESLDAKSTLYRLPNDVLHMILKDLDIDSVKSCRLTCKLFNEIIQKSFAGMVMCGYLFFNTMRFNRMTYRFPNATMMFNANVSFKSPRKTQQIRDKLQCLHRPFYVLRSPDVKTLDVSPFRTLVGVYLHGCISLEALDVRDMPNIERVIVNKCESLTTLKLSDMPVLQTICVKQCRLLQSMLLGTLTRVKYVSIIECRLRALYVGELRQLRSLFINHCYSLTVSGLDSTVELKRLVLHGYMGTMLPSIALYKNLYYLYIARCPHMRSVRISNHRVLDTVKVISCRNMQRVDIRNCPLLKSVHVHSNRMLSHLHVASLPACTRLYVSMCKLLDMLTLSHVPKLRVLSVKRCNCITSVNVHEHTALSEIEISGCANMLHANLAAFNLRKIHLANCVSLCSVVTTGLFHVDKVCVTECPSLSISTSTRLGYLTKQHN